MPFGIGAPELAIILVIVVIIFGVGKLPEIGGALGKGIREFKTETGIGDEDAKDGKGKKGEAAKLDKGTTVTASTLTAEASAKDREPVVAGSRPDEI